MRFKSLVLLLALTLASPAKTTESPTVPLALAEQAVTKASGGSYADAARLTRDALETAPDNTALLALRGAIQLHTADYANALKTFRQAVATRPDDSLALYGLGLASLGTGNREAALNSFIRAEQKDGNRFCLLAATRYVQFLDGTQIAVSDAGMPNYLLPAWRTLEGMQAVRKGEKQAAVTALEAAQKALPGDGIVPVNGLLMTFEANKPLRASASPIVLPQETEAAPAKVLRGEVGLGPEGDTRSVAYVSYSLDGGSLGIVNVAPFGMVWDSKQTPNGTHTLEVALYDRNGREMGRTERKVRVVNPNGKAVAEADPERTGLLRAALWQLLALRPDRVVAAYTLGTTCQALGDRQGTRQWFLRAAAARPDYRDTAAKLRQSGGVRTPEDAVYGGLPTEKVIALTFDDGPKPGLTEPLLDLLVREQIPSTFFVIGRHIAANPELAKKITDAGMEMANHSYTHPNLTRLSEADITREFVRTQAAIYSATGKLAKYVRPPGGNWNPKVAKVAREWGLTPCFWTVDVYGSEVLGAQQVADQVLAQVRPGSILLMHNGKLNTLQALPTIIRELRKRGYAFTTVETLVTRLNLAKAAERRAAVAQGMARMKRGE